MKRLVTVVIVLGVILGGIALYKPSTIEVINQEPEVVEKEVQVDALDKAIKDAQDAKKDAIHATAQSAYDEAYNQEMKKVELEVIKAFGEKLDARQTELEKETKTYWTRERIVALIKDTFPEDYERAISIALCESNLNPNAHNGKNKNGTSDGGLYQINSTHDKRLKELGLNKYDPEDNVQYARMLFEEHGWQPWVCHTRGLAYKR